MKLLFCYTGPLVKDLDGNFYSRTINDKLLNRYFLIADEVVILSRVKIISDELELNKYTKINNKKLVVKEYQNLNKFLVSRKNNKALKRELFDIVTNVDLVVVRLPNWMGDLVCSIAKKMNKPLLVEVVGCTKDAYWNHSLKGKIIALPSYLLMKKSVYNADFVLYVTQNFLQQRYPTKGNSLGCSDVVLNDINETILLKRLQKIENLSEKKKIILGTVGAVDVRYKGHKDVIIALAEANKLGGDFEYWLAGGGNQHSLESIAKRYGVTNEVKFLGNLPHNNIFDFLDEIDMYIQPSLTEGLPRSLIEAMSRGCPTLGSNVGGIPELLVEDEIFNKHDHIKIRDYLLSINKDILKQSATRNFKESQKFVSESLEKKRFGFYKEFYYLARK